jgi:hypothetical protein
MHEELRRSHLQNRVPDVHEVLQKVRATDLSDLRWKFLIAALTCGIGGFVALDAGFVAAENLQRLSGAQMRARFAGRELTDEVHWRTVYQRDRTLRNYALGSKKVGKWSIQGDDLCIDLPEPDGGCFEVALSGTRIVMTPTGLGLPYDGILEAISDPKWGKMHAEIFRSTSSDIAAKTFL